MKKCITLMTVLSVLVFLGGAVSAEVLYSNDFGTTQQFNAFEWESVSGDGTAALVRDGALSGPNPPGDLDSDGLYESVTEDTSDGIARGAIHVFAPFFHTMNNISVSGYGLGDASTWLTGVDWKLSYDGEDWTHEVGTDGSGVWKQYTVVGTGDPNYVNATDVWACFELYSEAGSGSYSSSLAGRTGAFQVEADTALGQPGQRVYIYYNDLGTAEQRAELMISGTVGYDDGDGIDFDGDGFAATMRTDWPGIVTATIEIEAPDGYAFKDPIATGTGFGGDYHYNSYTQVRLSVDGYHWDVDSTYPPDPATYPMEADATGLANYQAVESVWVQFYMYSWYAPRYMPKARNLMVTAELVAGSAAECGDNGYLAGDIAGAGGVPDCYVNLLDIAQVASEWLECTDPSGENCVDVSE
ncbi:MAG: hypothetical protein JW936_05420 [Sedimentisphaerales bacterium]|nr:hypothetical protein [Sedimentisphaerales bacterium]